ncbi:MAG: Asp-tRNA(Asn)/Glu-tRNA(Gln) amidotransferase subunit GatA [Thermotogota bacterium]|nr:Asp-tRNA(Asn)/Glu-tRNA(Gln) amidotransferase subunit GatA [Thermotogota bacterium]
MNIWMNSVEELIKLIKTKKIKPNELQRYYLNRLNIVDEKVKGFIHLTAQEDHSPSEGLLSGIPYALKDNIMALGSQTTAASKILWNYRSTYDATVVKHLKNEGGILLGKTNMDEFSMGSTTEHSAFFSTKNPWDLERIPGGSSGGSAVAVATGMVPFALGSDTGGSIRLPASYCGVVGYKPSYSLISRYGLVAFASSMDQIGPITRSVRDAALITNVISRRCPYDTTKRNTQKDYLKNIEEHVDGFRVACIRETIEDDCDPHVLKRFEEAVVQLQWMGIKIDYINLKQYRDAYPVYTIISSAEASSNLARYDGILYGLKVQPTDKTNPITKTREMGFGPEVKRRILLGTFNLSHQRYEDYYRQALLFRGALTQQFEVIFRSYDAIISPVSKRTPGKIGDKTDIKAMNQYDSNTVLANLAGLPAISVPMGFVGTTPVGLQFMGNRFEDDKLLRLARAYEKTAGIHEDGSYPAPHIEGVDDA